MSSFGFLLSCMWTITILQLGCSNLHLKFKEYEELRPENFTVVVKRNLVSGQVRLKLVSFYALRKYFVMFLSPGSPVLSKDFEANTMDSKGQVTPFRVDPNIFYTGYINGNPQHGVDAVRVDELWIAHIYAPDDVYSIEPLTHHEPNSSISSMLIFKHSDVNSSLQTNMEMQKDGLHPFCEEVHFGTTNQADTTQTRQKDGENELHKNIPTKKTEHHIKTMNSNHFFKDMLSTEGFEHRILQSEDNLFRKESLKRDQNRRRLFEAQGTEPIYNTCDMFVIADYEMFKGLGRRDFFRVSAVLIHIYQVADSIFRQTFFDDFHNVGFNIAKLMIHTTYTNITEHYNNGNVSMTGMDTLQSMTKITNFTDFCLVHLTTQRNFGGTLGLAATAELKSFGWSNGICARNLQEARNIGLSTTMNAYSELIPILTYILVLTHEIGHNWGSHHDPPDDPICSPTWKQGGKYIMWSYSGQTSGVHAKLFSPCSRNEIGEILQDKAHACFMRRNSVQRYCGNGIVDDGEDCDTGYVEDACCKMNCRFKPRAICSPFNHACCTKKCQVAPRTQKCFLSSVDDCYEKPFCSGVDINLCDQSKPLPNNSSCHNLGRCWNGKCIPFCQLLGLSFKPSRRLESCSCETDRESMCMHCCWDANNAGICKIMGGPYTNGSSCLLGYCKNGQCVNSEEIIDFNFDDLSNLKITATRGNKLNSTNPVLLALVVLSFIYFMFLI